MNHFASLVGLACALAAALGCDTNIPIAKADGGPGVDPFAGCTGTLDEVAYHPYSATPCAATYDDALAHTACFGPGGVQQAGPCAGQLFFVQNFYVHSFTCVYDPTTRALIGARGSEDTPHYCGGRASEITAGTVPFCVLSTLDHNRDCSSDAGP